MQTPYKTILGAVALIVVGGLMYKEVINSGAGIAIIIGILSALGLYTVQQKRGKNL